MLRAHDLLTAWPRDALLVHFAAVVGRNARPIHDSLLIYVTPFWGALANILTLCHLILLGVVERLTSMLGYINLDREEPLTGRPPAISSSPYLEQAKSLLDESICNWRAKEQNGILRGRNTHEQHVFDYL
jgi:hypothetical protein